MENNKLHNIWKKVDSEINYKTEKELEMIIKNQTKKVLSKYYYFISLSILISLSFIIFLLTTAFNRTNDTIYQLNNYFICLMTLFSLMCAIWSLNKLQNNNNNLPLKEWLKEKIKWLSKVLSSKLAYYLMPIIGIPSILSVHVYFEYKPFLEVIKNEESIFGLSFGLLIGSLVSYFLIRKIRKHHLEKLEFLKDLYGRLCNMH